MMNLIINLVMVYLCIGLFWVIATIVVGALFSANVENEGGCVTDMVDTIDSSVEEEGFTESVFENPVPNVIKSCVGMMLSWPLCVIFMFNIMIPMMIDKIKELKSKSESGG
jgi:hypothetical protein